MSGNAGHRGAVPASRVASIEPPREELSTTVHSNEDEAGALVRPACFRKCREKAADLLLPAVTTLSIATPIETRSRTAAKKTLPSASGRAESTRNRGGASRLCAHAALRRDTGDTACVPEITAVTERLSSASFTGGSYAEPVENVPTWPPRLLSSRTQRDAVATVLGVKGQMHHRGARPSSDVLGQPSRSSLACCPVVMNSTPDPHVNAPVHAPSTTLWAMVSGQEAPTAPERKLPPKVRKVEQRNSPEMWERVGQKQLQHHGREKKNDQSQSGTSQVLAGYNILQKVNSSIASPISLGTFGDPGRIASFNNYCSRRCPQACTSEFKAREGSQLCHSQPSSVHEPLSSFYNLPCTERDSRFSLSMTSRHSLGNSWTLAEVCTIPPMTACETRQPCEHSSVDPMSAHTGSSVIRPARFHWGGTQKQPVYQETSFRAPFSGAGRHGSSDGSQSTRSSQPCSKTLIQQGLMPNIRKAPATSSTQCIRFAMPAMSKSPSAGQAPQQSLSNSTANTPLCWSSQHQQPEPSYRRSTKKPNVAVPSAGVMVPDASLLSTAEPITAAPLICKVETLQQQLAAALKGRARAHIPDAAFPTPDKANKLGTLNPQAKPNLNSGAVVLEPGSAVFVAPASPPAVGHKTGLPQKRVATGGDGDGKSKRQKLSDKSYSNEVAKDCLAIEIKAETPGGLMRVGSPNSTANTPLCWSSQHQEPEPSCIKSSKRPNVTVPSAGVIVTDASLLSTAEPATAAPLICKVEALQQPSIQQQSTAFLKGRARAHTPDAVFPTPDKTNKPGTLDSGAVVLEPGSAVLVAPASPPAVGHKAGLPQKRVATSGGGGGRGKSKRQKINDKSCGNEEARDCSAIKIKAETSGGLTRAAQGIGPGPPTMAKEGQAQSVKKCPRVGRMMFGKPFLQDASCCDIAPRLQKCRECWARQYGNRNNTPDICRFSAFRKLQYSQTGVVHKSGFLEPSEASGEDFKLWLPQSDCTPSDVDVATARAVLSHVGAQFLALVKQEIDARSLHVGVDETVLWKRAIKGARELCDVCKTTLFNIHWTCQKCGFVVCIDCYKAKKDAKASSVCVSEKGDVKWPSCTNRHRHLQGDLVMTQIIASTVLCNMSQHVRRFMSCWSTASPSICGVQNNDIGRQINSALMSAVNSCFSDEKASTSSNDIGHVWESGKQPVAHVAKVFPGEAADRTGKRLSVLTRTLHPSAEMEGTSKIQKHSDESGSNEEDQDISGALLSLIRLPTGSNVRQTQVDQVMAVTVERFLKNDGKHCSNRRKECDALPLHVCTFAQSSILFPKVPHSWLCNGKLLVLYEPRNEGNMALFQTLWKRSRPVLVCGVSDNLTASLWHPNSFCHDFGHMKTDLINCLTGLVLQNQPMQAFWEGFENLSKRMKNEDGECTLLKLKDWPPGDDFSDVLPARFADLMTALPLPQYTHRDGAFNLVGRLPDFFVRPDLGPKMYTAYGSALYPSKGTTNLHLDVSDAVNVMVYVGIPKDGDAKEHVNKALKVIDDACDTLTRKRVRKKGAKPGALWHIYNAHDADKIRELLRKVAAEQGRRVEPGDDPIHDQAWYLDHELRERLRQEYSIEGYAIVQCLGDAVFIPAGAPHQVQNLHNCIKVAEDFVSPENITHCFNLTQEFRWLSDMHTNHEDKLQIKNVIYHAVKDAISVLLASSSGKK